MEKIKKAAGAIKKYLFQDTRYFFQYVYRYPQNNFHNDCRFYSDQELINLLQHGKSIIRIGDGEIGVLHRLPITVYQVYSDALRADLLKIIKNYTNDSNYVLMIPLFVNETNKKLRDTGRFQGYMPLKITYELIFNKHAGYFDQHVFYKDGGFGRLILPYAKTKKMIIVTNAGHVEKIKASGRADDVFDYIVCGNKNTYESRAEIQTAIVEMIKKTGLPKSDFIVLMSAGLSKTIIYDLSKEGYQILDIGKGLESYYMDVSIQHLI
jgi:hypothetical protein